MRTTQLAGWLISVATLMACGGSVEPARPPRVATDAAPGPVCRRREIREHGERVRREAARVTSVAVWTPEACEGSRRALDELASESCSEGAARTDARYLGATVRDRCGDHEGAIAEYLRVIESSPRHCESLVAIGRDALARGDLDRARIAFERAAHRSVRCVGGWEGLAAIQRRDPSSAGAAVQSAQRVIALEPTRASGYVELALAHLAVGQLELAEDAIARGIAVDPSIARAHVARGLIAERRDDVHGAIAAYDRAIENDPDAIDARMNRGGLLVAVRAYDDAERDFRRAVELEPARYEAWLGLGIALRGLGRTEEARAAYERAIEIDRDRPEAYFDLGVLLQDYGSGSQQDDHLAARRLRQFVERARGRDELQALVDEVERTCPQPESDGARRSARRARARARGIGSASECLPGRLWRLESSRCRRGELTQMHAEAQRMAAEIEAQAEQQRRAQESESSDVRGEGAER